MQNLLFNLKTNRCKQLAFYLLLSMLFTFLSNYSIAQGFQVKEVKLELSKHGAKKGIYFDQEPSSDSTKFYTGFTYRPKKRLPVQMDIVTFDENGQQIDLQTANTKSDIAKIVDISIDKEDANAKKNLKYTKDGFATGKVVAFKGVHLFAQNGAISLEYKEGSDQEHYPLNVSGDKIRFDVDKTKILYGFVNNRLSEMWPYQYKIETNTKEGILSDLKNMTATHAVVYKGESVLVGGIVSGKVDLKGVNPDFNQYRFYTATFNSQTMQAENVKYHEFKYTLQAVKQREFFENGNTEIVLSASELTNVESFKITEIEGNYLIRILFDPKGNILEQDVYGNGSANEEKVDFKLVKHQKSFLKYGFKTKNSGKPTDFFIARYSKESTWEKDYSMDEIENKMAAIDGKKAKFKIDRAGITIDLDKTYSLPNGDIILIGTAYKGGSFVTFSGSDLNTKNNSRNIAFQIDWQTGELKAYYEINGIKGSVQQRAPIVHIMGNDVVVLFRDVTEDLNVTSYVKGNYRYYINTPFSHGTLVHIDGNSRSVSKPYVIDKAYLYGHQPMFVSKTNTILLDVSANYLPTKKLKPSKLVINLMR